MRFNRLVASVLVLLYAALIFPQAGKAQEALLDEIIESHVAALGGKEAIAKVNNFRSRSTVALKGGFGDMSGSADEVVDLKRKRLYSNLDLGRFRKTEAVVGNAGWTKGTEGDRDMSAQEVALSRMSIGISPLLSAYESTKEDLKVEEVEEFNKKKCHVVSAGSNVRYFIDIKTGLFEGMKIANVGTFIVADYREAAGVQFASRRNLKIEVQGISIEYVIRATKVNVEIDEGLFGELANSKGSAKPEFTAEEIVKFLDKDGDELISSEEASASPELGPAFGLVDTDQDGFIDMSEARAMVEYTKNEKGAQPKNSGKKITAKELVASMDRNSDGKISRRESNAELQPFFGDIDANGDGFVDTDEAQAVVDFVNGNR